MAKIDKIKIPDGTEVTLTDWVSSRHYSAVEMGYPSRFMVLFTTVFDTFFRDWFFERGFVPWTWKAAQEFKFYGEHIQCEHCGAFTAKDGPHEDWCDYA